MPAPRHRPSSSWFRCRAALFLMLASLIAAMPAFAQETPASPRHHPHHAGHSRAGHHATSHHPAHPKQAVHAPPPPPPPPISPPSPHPAVPPVPANIGSNTGLPLPRFAALRADEVNMRSGPGTRYPILWLYKRRDLPVRIEREFDVWRLVEDFEGVKGWVHQATLVGTRSFVVIASSNTAAGSAEVGDPDHGAGALLRDDPRDDAGIVAILRPGVIGRLRACPAGSDWCRVSAHSYSGWLQRSAIFGLLPGEAIPPP